MGTKFIGGFRQVLGKQLFGKRMKSNPRALAIILHETITRPLRRGYYNVEGFIEKYLQTTRCQIDSNPDLGSSLVYVETIKNLNSFFGRIGNLPLCLIQGYAAPANGEALNGFLQRQGIRLPRIDAIDLLDVASVCKKNGISMPQVNFHVADAADLRQMYGNNTVDLIIQDYLLNCTPHAIQGSIVEEVDRILNPRGVAVVSFTDNLCIQSLDAITYGVLENKYGITIDESAYSLRDTITPDHNLGYLLEALCGNVIIDPTGKKFTLVTGPDGNFEFFTSFETIEKMLDDFNLSIATMARSEGMDRNSLNCQRYHALIRKKDI